jgi:hypothetical protein
MRWPTNYPKAFVDEWHSIWNGRGSKEGPTAKVI